MAIKSPSTYGDYWWSQQVEAQQAFDESLEQVLWPYVSSLFREMPEVEDMSPAMQNFIRVLGEPPSPGFGDLVKLTGAEFGAEMLKDALTPFMLMLRRATNRRSRETWLTAQEAITLAYRKKIDDDFFYLLTASEGYEDLIADYLYTAAAPYPTIPDIMLYTRYHNAGYTTRDKVWEHFDVPSDEYDLWEWLSLQRLSLLDAHTLYRRGVITEGDFVTEVAKMGWRDTNIEHVKEIGWTVPNAMLLVQGCLQQLKSDPEILQSISHGDIHPLYAQTYMDAILTKPSSQDIIAYELRRDPKLTGLPQQLRKIGIHGDYTDVYRTLAYQIPPVADIITMAVREAFTPAIAERFGQYEDFPPQFQEWAAKKGLTEEWAKRYWAAHWSLPSPLQGFEMLHRGVINEDELDLLLRALDIMPFWREKLTKIAYRRLTRVDVRRMYGVGVLDEAGVYEAYLEQGYSERDAKRMSDFTVRQTLATLSKFTSTDVVTAYTKRMISRTEANSLLGELGIRYEDRDYILSTADYKREWELTESKISAVKNLYKKRQYTESQARDALSKLDLPAEQISVLMEQWFIEEKAEPVRTWTTAQVLTFTKSGLITNERGISELRQIGYDTEHINVYMDSIK